MKIWTTFEIPPLFPQTTGWTLRFKRGPDLTVEITMHWNGKPEPSHMFVLSQVDFLTILKGVLDEPTPGGRVQSVLDEVNSRSLTQKSGSGATGPQKSNLPSSKVILPPTQDP